MIYLELFGTFFQIGLLSIGGGYAILPLIQQHVVEQRGWLTMTAFSDLLSISQMTPGPIAINAATFVGIQTAGFPGAVVATIGCIAGPSVIVSLLAFFYFRYKQLTVVKGVLAGLRPAVVAMIGSAGLSIILLAFWGEGGFVPSIRAMDFVAVALFAASFLLLRLKKPSGSLVILGSGLLGGALYLLL